jgi:hypothetical protein
MDEKLPVGLSTVGVLLPECDGGGSRTVHGLDFRTTWSDVVLSGLFCGVYLIIGLFAGFV